MDSGEARPRDIADPIPEKLFEAIGEHSRARVVFTLMPVRNISASGR